MSEQCMGRVTKDRLRDLCAYNPVPAKPLDWLPHNCYIIQFANLTDIKVLKRLKEMGDESGTRSAAENNNQADFVLINSENMEFFLDYFKLTGSAEQLESQRKSQYVYEDNFYNSLTSMISSTAFYENLATVCYGYEKHALGKPDRIIETHRRRSNETYLYFLE